MAQSVEAPPVFQAAAALPDVASSGPHYVINDQVENDGFMNFYVITSDYGTFTAQGNTRARGVIREIYAITTLRESSKLQALGAGIKDGAVQTFDAAATLVEDPMGTVEKIPGGMKRLFSNASRALDRSASGEKGDTEDNAFHQSLGFSRLKRQLAVELGVDPYSPNPALQEALNASANALFIGNMSVKAVNLAMPVAVAIPISATRATKTVSEKIIDESPVNLERNNTDLLTYMGLDTWYIDSFVQNTSYRPTHETVITQCLYEMRGVQNIDLFLQYAINALDDNDAIRVTRQAELLLDYHQTKGELKSFRLISGIPIAETMSGKLLFIGEVDYLSWTTELAQVVTGIRSRLPYDLQTLPFEVVITGKFSPMSKQALQDLGYLPIGLGYSEIF
jgi:hypothetical protein